MTIQTKDFRNFSAKHSRNKSGAGRHAVKNGIKAARNRQKTNWQRQLLQEC